jgi:NTP pyrophosphatase (non-canonical NTP hydrolase)
MRNTYEQVAKKILSFRSDRDWEQFHSPKNLACSISIEAGELLELFQWAEHCPKEKIKEEVADIGIYLIYLCNDMGINLMDAIIEKVSINESKYPIEKSKGNSKKYDIL